MAIETSASPAAPDAETRLERDRQMRQAEELLFSGPARGGFVKGLFRGRFDSHGLWPYPKLSGDEQERTRRVVDEVRAFARDHIDAAAIDRDADIPRSVIDGLGRLGVLGMAAPGEYGGLGASQRAYCQVMEVIGGHCASTAVFVNAHHSIGIRALVLFGSKEQKDRWLPPLVKGEKLAAFALTEKEAGSDASNVQTTAAPIDGGRAYRLNGTKRYITNGGIADVLTVMARTPDPAGGESKITAFLVTPDLPGFQVVRARMEKCGIRGTATGELAFHDMDVPASNVLGPPGKGLRVALTVLDFGRTTFGATCAGAAKACLAAAVKHANQRRQFGRTLASLDLIKKKIALMAANAYAMEAATTQTAALIDSGSDDYMLETAILKVFATEALWDSVYEVLQIHGGQGYFTDEPYERWMRDARINQIGEGANEVLKSFIALGGMRDLGRDMQGTLESVKTGRGVLGSLWRFGKEHAVHAAARVNVPSVASDLKAEAQALAGRVYRFGWSVERQIFRHRIEILERQYVHERIADAAILLYASSCVLARLDASSNDGSETEAQRAAGRLFLRRSFRRIDEALAALGSNDDELTTRAADLALASS